LEIDISQAYPKSVDRLLGEPFDFVFTVCGNADQACPAFHGTVGRRVHIGFDDPAANPTIEEFRRVRDQIREQFQQFYQQEITRLL
jgi:arsenate reductase